jgi:NAD-dependent dihydropyrimidine dehydrogenase PreA subunit
VKRYFTRIGDGGEKKCRTCDFHRRLLDIGTRFRNTETTPNRCFLFCLGRSANGENMTYIIVEPCINVKDTACVDVCPVDCIHPRKDEAGFADAVQLYINPDECIDCGACEPACPVAAIFPEEEVPEKWKQYIQVNYDYWKK